VSTLPDGYLADMSIVDAAMDGLYQAQLQCDDLVMLPYEHWAPGQYLAIVTVKTTISSIVGISLGAGPLGARGPQAHLDTVETPLQASTLMAFTVPELPPECPPPKPTGTGG
jgi:hypothetical protein